MKKLLYSLLLGVVLTGCCNNPPPIPRSRQVVIMYMIADNNLQSSLLTNVNQVLSSITLSNFSNEDRLFILFDGGTNNTYLQELIPPHKTTPASWKRHITYDSFDSSNPEEMQAFLREIQRIAPSEHYGIILSSHGSGWIPKELISSFPTQQSPSVSGLNPALEHDLSWLFDKQVTRSFGMDNNNRSNTMSIDDIVSGLSPIHFDFVMFDACFMGSVELLYALRNSTDYVIASSVEIMMAGFPYQIITPFFFDNSKTLEERLINVADYFVRYYKTADLSIISERSAVIAVTKMSEMDGFAEAVHNIYMYESNHTVNAFDVRGLESMTTHVFFDLNDYLTRLCGDTELYNHYLEQYERTVIFKDNTTYFYSYNNGYGQNISANGLCGLSMYVTRPQYPIYASHWNSTEWAQAITNN